MSRRRVASDASGRPGTADQDRVCSLAASPPLQRIAHAPRPHPRRLRRHDRRPPVAERSRTSPRPVRGRSDDASEAEWRRKSRGGRTLRQTARRARERTTRPGIPHRPARPESQGLKNESRVSATRPAYRSIRKCALTVAAVCARASGSTLRFACGIPPALRRSRRARAAGSRRPRPSCADRIPSS